MEENNVLVREVFRLNSAVLELTEKHNSFVETVGTDISKICARRTADIKKINKSNTMMALSIIGLCILGIAQEKRIVDLELRMEKDNKKE